MSSSLNALAVKGKHALFDGVRIALQVFRDGVFEFFVFRLQQDVEIDGERLFAAACKVDGEGQKFPFRLLHESEQRVGTAAGFQLAAQKVGDGDALFVMRL